MYQLSSEDGEPSHGKMRKVPYFKYSSLLFHAQEWVRSACSPLLPVSVLLFLLFYSFFIMMAHRDLSAVPHRSPSMKI